MRLIHLDAVGGVAGDMFVAALIDALPELRARVLADARAVLPAGCVVDLAEKMSGGIRALRFAVDVRPEEADRGATTYAALAARITGADLAEGTRRHAGAILRLLGETEARIHGIALDCVHFHEISDWDSVADVVAAGSIVAALGEASWTIGDLPRGGGLMRTQHGMLPVPAPATAALLTGFAWREDGIGGERVTPTGAAILRHLCAGPAGTGSQRLAAVGTGAGTRELPGMPNVLRALVFEEDAGEGLRDRIAVISFDIDDMTGEELGEAADRIRHTSGVIDVSMSAALGKKGRPLTCFRVLAREGALAAVRRACLQQTSSLGVRWRVEEREVLAREEREQRGGLRVKAAVRPGGAVTVKAESDDLREAHDLAERRERQHKAEFGGAP